MKANKKDFDTFNSWQKSMYIYNKRYIVGSVKSVKIWIYNSEYLPELIEFKQIAVAIIISSW